MITSAKSKEMINPYVSMIAQSEGLENVNFKFNNICNEGENNIGEVYKVIISSHKADTKADLSVVVKILNIESAFNRILHKTEIKAYKTIFSQLERFQNQYRIKDEYRYKFIKCYNTTDCAIILEDLTEIGCEVKNKFVSPDFKHASKVMMHIAKLQGLSFAMEKLEPEIFKQMTYDFQSPLWNQELLDTGLKEGLLAIYNNSMRFVKNVEIKMKLEVLKDKMNELMKCYYEPKENSVITHGDLWTTNILFNYTVSNYVFE